MLFIWFWRFALYIFKTLIISSKYIKYIYFYNNNDNAKNKLKKKWSQYDQHKRKNIFLEKYTINFFIILLKKVGKHLNAILLIR